MYVIQPNVFVVFILLNLFKIIYNNLIKFSKQFNNLYVIWYYLPLLFNCIVVILFQIVYTIFKFWKVLKDLILRNLTK